MEELKEETIEDIEKEIKELESSNDRESTSNNDTLPGKKEDGDKEDDKPDYLTEKDVIEEYTEDMCEVEEFG